MASSQVEIAAASSSPSSPFGCILNRGSRAGRGGGGAAFQKNLKELVRDHLHTCISVNSNDNDAGFDQQHHHHHGNANFLNRNNAGADEMTTIMSQKQAKLLDRWAARQAKEMVSELKADDDCQDSENLAASFLVQIWEARLQHPPTPRPTIPNSHQTTLSGFCSFSSSLESDKSLISSPLDSECTTAMSSSVQSRRNSDAGGDSEKLRVADIIRRLACNGNDNGGQQTSVCHGGDSPVHRVDRRPTTSLASPNSSDQADAALPRVSMPQLVVASPRMIRGRQAFNDLLVQLEKERHVEVQSLVQRHAVSKFPQRGRIQSMLRLRIMQRSMGMTVQDHIRPPSFPCTTSTSGPTSQNHGSTISHLRERFTACIEQAKRAPNITATSSEIPETTQSSTSAEPCEDKTNKESTSDEPSNTPQMFQDSFASRMIELPNSFENATQTRESSVDAPAETDVTCQEGTSSCTIELPGSFEKQPTQESSVAAPAETDITCQEGTSSYVASYGSQETSQTSGSSDEWDEDEIEREEEEQVSELDDYEYTTDDWCSSISRPRSYWESIRQAWYNELLSTTSATDEIRKLLERRTVSSFLASDFRDRMDRLMVSRTKLQAAHRQEEMEDNQESMGHLMLSYFQRHTHSTTDQEDAEAETRTEQLGLDQQQGGQETGDQESSVQYPPPPSYVIEASNQESERVSISTGPSPPPPPPPPPQWPGACQEDRQAPTSTSGNGHSNSTEMELITDLRGQMEQLQREMAELRKTLQASMEMQLHHQYHAYPNLSSQPPPLVRKEDMNLVDMSNKRRVCCICYEMPVDTFLYRCGHMCTCLKCAHELQWSSGKCPICRAPILDVVRAYLDS